MKTLGIDQSYTCTGIVVIVDGEVVHKATFASPKALTIYQRANYLAKTILTEAEFHKPDTIGIEGLAFGMRGDATRDLAGLQFVIMDKLQFEGGYKVDVVAPNAVKKFATGNGRAKKQELFESLPEKTQKEFLDFGVTKTKGLYDLTDAYWIAKLTEDNNQPK